VTPTEEAERRLVAAVLEDPSLYERTQINPATLSDIKLRATWEAMGSIKARGGVIDAITVCDELGETLEAIGGMAGISSLLLEAGVVTPESTLHYADMVRDAYLSRQVQAKCSEILTRADELSGKELLARLSTSSDSLTASLSRPTRTLRSVLLSELKTVTGDSGAPRGICTGLKLERWMPGGFPLGKVVSLFADTATFKTSTIVQMMDEMSMAGHHGALASFEDPDELTADRNIARKTGIPYGTIAGGVLDDAERQYLKSVDPGKWKHLDRVHCNDGLEPRIEDIIRWAASLDAQLKGKLDYVVVDYMQLLEGNGKRMEVYEKAMRQAALAAKRLNLVWIFVSQRNSKWEDRKNPRPELGDMFGSSSMKQQSKTVIALFRPSEHWLMPEGDSPLWGMYTKFLKRFRGGDPMAAYRNIVELWLLKNVMGQGKRLMTLMANPACGILDEFDMRSYL
jgi:replicative DNA helicase